MAPKRNKLGGAAVVFVGAGADEVAPRVVRARSREVRCPKSKVQSLKPEVRNPKAALRLGTLQADALRLFDVGIID